MCECMYAFSVVSAQMFIEYLVKGQVATFGLISSCVHLYAMEYKFMRVLRYTFALYICIYICMCIGSSATNTLHLHKLSAFARFATQLQRSVVKYCS